MQPTDDKSETLYCFQDNERVPADKPQCLHPSSQCPFRSTCEVVEAEREMRRSGGAPRS
jgi:hypothetical protein